MAGGKKFKSWISLLISRFGRTKNLSGEYKAIETAAIPTLSMVAEWARDKSEVVSEVWVFGSSLDHDSWDRFNDDLDILLVVPDKYWKPDMERELVKEIPLSDQYLRMDIRVRRESDCEPWRTEALLSEPFASDEEGHKMSLAEYAMRTGVCVWRRPEDKPEA